VPEFRSALGDLISGLSIDDMKVIASHFDSDGAHHHAVLLALIAVYLPLESIVFFTGRCRLQVNPVE
jgi:hypothetical protein